MDRDERTQQRQIHALNPFVAGRHSQFNDKYVDRSLLPQ
ncbi:hypothetical protein SFR_3553 [Streptomyces sp. FR-008]|nr:hypothetical protein SFR_3553 [Streptomyces sp. FR-008]